MLFCPQTDTLVLNLMRSNGIYPRYLSLNNVVPWTYGDLNNTNSLVSTKLPFIIDP